MIRIYSVIIPSSSLWVFFFFVCFFDTTAETGRNRKSTWVSIQIIGFCSQGLLDTASQFWTFLPPSRLLLPATVALGFPEYKVLLSLSLTCSPSWKKSGQPLTLPSLCHICKWKWSSYISHSQDRYEDPPRKLNLEELWNDTCLYGTNITMLTHSSDMHLGQQPWVTRWGGPG